jgi:hypothetical protein
MVRRPVPISLRIRANEASAEARRVLRRLDGEADARRRFKHHAARAYLAITEMRGDLERLSFADRDRWQGEMKRIESMLLKISQHGVR